jgi:hypothetical protein
MPGWHRNMVLGCLGLFSLRHGFTCLRRQAADLEEAQGPRVSLPQLTRYLPAQGVRLWPSDARERIALQSRLGSGSNLRLLTTAFAVVAAPHMWAHKLVDGGLWVPEILAGIRGLQLWQWPLSQKTVELTAQRMHPHTLAEGGLLFAKILASIRGLQLVQVLLCQMPVKLAVQGMPALVPWVAPQLWAVWSMQTLSSLREALSNTILKALRELRWLFLEARPVMDHQLCQRAQRLMLSSH